ncbi:methylenetetrahydrofolate reductase [Candidatus Bathyarchaeota archaeon]|nr:methylenetetrahydrofolate reductase [Candidatus Bathyarchaeota archaeon]
MTRGEAYSELMKNLQSGKFTYTGELEPLKTTNLHEVLEGAKTLKGHVTAANVTDNPTAFAYMTPLVPCYFIQKEVGLETVYQLTTRDRNRLAITSDLLGAGALGIRNVLALTGDHVVVGDNPQAKPVFDLDSATLVYLLRKMVDEGVDLNGGKIQDPPKFNVGVAASPNANPIEAEILKIERKVLLGADFIQTQAIYDIEVAKQFLRETSRIKAPILIGIAPFKSIGMMEYMMKFVPGIVVPEEMEQRLRKAREKGGKEALYKENVEIFGDFIKEIKKTTHAAGMHIMAIGFEQIVPKIIEKALDKTLENTKLT